MLGKKIIFLTLVMLFFTGCANNQEMYYWGEYEQVLYDSYVNPGSIDTQTQVEKINTDIQKTEASGKKIAPGIYAHLGFLYALQGKTPQSKSALIEEKALFPEASKFIDGMVSRATINQRNLND